MQKKLILIYPYPWANRRLFHKDVYRFPQVVAELTCANFSSFHGPITTRSENDGKGIILMKLAMAANVLLLLFYLIFLRIFRRDCSYIFVMFHVSIPTTLCSRVIGSLWGSRASIIVKSDLDAYAVDPLYSNSPVRRWLISNLDGVADVIVGETTKAVDQLRSFFNFSNVVFCPNGLDFRPIENTSTIGRQTDLIIVSRFFDKRKGANLYRAVLPQLLDLGIKIHIIGEGATEFSLQHNFFSHPGLIVTESLQHDEVLRAMADSKIFLSLSIYESFIIALIEAYAMGCRIITTPVGVAEDLAKTSESVSLVSFCPEEILSTTSHVLKFEHTKAPLDSYNWQETVRCSGLLHCLI